MMVMGGLYPSGDNYRERDTRTQGINIFDMTEMRWKNSYDAGAEAYKTPEVVKSYYRANGGHPINWTSDAVKALFYKKTGLTVTSNSSQISRIAAGTMPAIVVVAITGGLLYWYYYQHPKKRAARMQQLPDSSSSEPESQVSVPPKVSLQPALLEMDSVSARFEVDSERRRQELDGGFVSPRGPVVELPGSLPPNSNKQWSDVFTR